MLPSDEGPSDEGSASDSFSGAASPPDRPEEAAMHLVLTPLAPSPKLAANFTPTPLERLPPVVPPGPNFPLPDDPEIFSPAIEPHPSDPDRSAAAPSWHPAVLVAQLDELQRLPAVSDWAAEADKLLHELAQQGLLGAEQQSLLEELRAVAAEGTHRAEELEQLGELETAPQLRRAAAALARRVDLWSAVAACQATSATRSASLPPPERLAACLTEVDRLLEAPAGADWRAYLLLDSLQRLASERLPDDAQALAQQALERLHAARLTPQQRQFLRAPALVALDLELRQMAVEPAEPLELLARLEHYEQSRLPSAARLVSADLRRLSLSPLAEERQLASRLEQHYRHANLRLSVTPQMLARLLPKQQPVTRPVQDAILGIPVEGQSTTVTRLGIRIVPGGEKLRFVLQAEGRVASTTRSRSGAAQLFSRTRSAFTAQQEVVLAADGFHAEPASAEATCDSRLSWLGTDYDGVPLLGPLARSIALGRYDEQRAAASREIQLKVAAQAREEMESLTRARLEELQTQWKSQVLVPLQRLALDGSLKSSSDGQRLAMELRLASVDQLAAHTPSPRPAVGSLATLQIHESALNNLLGRMELEGRTFTPVELRQWICQKLNRPCPPPTQEQEADDTLITFADHDAVRVRCEAGRLELSLAIAELESGSRYWRDFTVSVSFRPDAEGPHVELLRDGPIGLCAARIGLQSQFILRGTVSRLFPPDTRLQLLSDQLHADPRFADLEFRQLALHDGWVGVSVVKRTEPVDGLAKANQSGEPDRTEGPSLSPQGSATIAAGR